MPVQNARSPAARTTATADIVCENWAVAPRREEPSELYGADPEEILDHLRSLAEEVRSVMVVGHNPTAQALELGLISDDDKEGRDLAVRRGFPTCALAIYTLDISAWSDVGQTARMAGLFTPPFAGS